MTRPAPVRSTALREALLVAAVAALVRAVVLLQAAGGPFFGEPLVDALTYHDLARDLATAGVYDERFLWQAPLYPLSLAALYHLVGVSVVAARVAGALGGVATVLLAWWLARRLLGRRAGLAAGLILGLHGVLVFFETRLLATGMATFWLVALVGLADLLARRPRPWLAAVLGLVGALALLTRPVLLPPAVAAAAWALWRWPRLRPWWRGWPRGALAVAVGASVVLAPFALVTHHHTGRAGLWPPSGGVNLYLGNHPDFPATLGIRPGLPWEELIATPVAITGQDDPWRNAGWFRGQALDYARSRPGDWLADLGEKARMLLGSREWPRNVDLQVHREESGLLAALVWRVGRFGFPAGVLLPLALVGLVAAWRRLTPLVPLVLVSYAATLVLVFPAARYRAPLWPLLTIAAVAGALALWRAWRGEAAAPARPRLLAVGGLTASVLLVVAPPPLAGGPLDLEAEMWHGVGYNQLRREAPAAAAQSFRRALDLRPRYPEAWNRLGVALARQDSFAAALACFERAADLAPDYPDPPRNLQLARSRLAEARFAAARRWEDAGNHPAAAAAYREAADLAPGWAEPRARLAWLLATTGVDTLRDGRQARRMAYEALAAHGRDHPWLRDVLAAAERQARADSLAAASD